MNSQNIQQIEILEKRPGDVYEVYSNAVHVCFEIFSDQKKGND